VSGRGYYKFSDRVEISNPGGLLFDKSEFGKRSFARNPLLADLVHRLRIVEKIGSGITRVKDILKKDVKFELFHDWFRVIILREDGVNVPVNVPVSRLEKIKEIILKNNTITIPEMANTLQVNEKTIKRDIEKLKKEFIIKRVGSDKTGHWEILDGRR